MFTDDIEALTDGQVIARRNMRLGLWAGMRLGLRGEKLTAYAREVMAADYVLPGPEDVIAKIRADFEEYGVDATDEVIRYEVLRREGQARAEMLATD